MSKISPNQIIQNILFRFINIWQIFFQNASSSLYDSNFYQNVYKNFKGYGVKHFLLCCTLASVINVVWLFGHFENIADYFKYNKPMQYSSWLDAIFTELPEIKYDGKVLNSPVIDDEVFCIKDPSAVNANLLCIDLSSKTKVASQASSAKGYLNLYRDKAMVLKQGGGVFQLSYDSLDIPSGAFDGPMLKTIIAGHIVSLEKFFLYTTLPIMLLFNVYNALVQNFLLLVCTGLFVKFRFKRNFQDGFRTAMFAISSIAVLKAILRIFIPYISWIEYYCMITVFQATRAIVRAEKF